MLYNILTDNRFQQARIHALDTMSLPSKSRLIELPAELCNTIYEMVLEDRHRNYKDLRWSWNSVLGLLLKHQFQYQPFAPTLLLYSKQIYSEAINIFYEETVCKFYCYRSVVERVTAWLSYLPKAQRLLIREIRLRDLDMAVFSTETNKSGLRWRSKLKKFWTRHALHLWSKFLF
jgi:hypothetical protein